MNTALVPSLTILKKSWTLALSKPNRYTFLLLGIIPQLFSFGFAFITGYLTANDNLESELTAFLSNTNGWILTGLGILAIIVLLLMIYFGIWYSALLYTVYQTTESNQTHAITQSVHSSRRVIRRLFMTSLKVGLFATLGFILLIIPGIIITVQYAFAPIIAVTEGGDVDPLKESKRLARGKFWELLRRSIIPFIFYSVPLSVFQSIHPILGKVWSISSPIFGLYFYLVYADFKRTTPATA